MRFTRLSSIGAAAMCLAGAAQAQNIHFNEIYASHSGTDTMEFIELIGTPGMSLANIVVCMVEGQGGGQGTLDRVWDLSDYVVPADGYFVMGNVAVANMDYDLATGPHAGGAADNIENGTETFYLLNVPNALDISDLENVLYHTNIDPDHNGETLFTDDPTSFITLENLTMMDNYTGTSPGAGGPGTPHDITFDCAEILGPDGIYFPAGMSRPGDYPNDWCNDTFLDFSNPGGADQTPGTANPSFVCGLTAATGAGCAGTGTGIGTPFCNPATNNSTGAPAVLTGSTNSGVGSGAHLEITGGVPGQLAYLLVGTQATSGIVVSNGQFCLVGGSAQFFRYNVAGTDMNSIGGFNGSGVMINAVGTSTTGFGFDVPNTVPATVPVTIMAGDTWHFQGWYRDTPAGVGTSNFTNGLSVTF
ncbi:MAG: hypothetical protein GY930_03235 [bacterium]|nr:hypothetical protein [bacterium]